METRDSKKPRVAHADAEGDALSMLLPDILSGLESKDDARKEWFVAIKKGDVKGARAAVERIIAESRVAQRSRRPKRR